MIKVHINIGSNSGHREALLEQAVAAISLALPGRVRVSDVIESEPWGFESVNRFLNVGVMVVMESDDSRGREERALEIFERLMEIQHSIDPSPHRDSEGNYIDRRIDIDLIKIDDWVVDTPVLTLPHPRMHLREFVMKPLRELEGGESIEVKV